MHVKQFKFDVVIIISSNLRIQYFQSLIFISTVCYVGSYQFMAYMAKTKYSESGQLLDSGLDLNMEGGIAE